MKTRTLSFRIGGLLCGLLAMLAGAVAPVRAQAVPSTMHPDRDRFVGVVTAVLGNTAAPNGVTLGLGLLSADLRVDARTVFIPQSIEAQVQGLVSGDYAVVLARRVKREWVARRILFDVDPIRPLRLFTGTIVHLSPDGTRFTLKTPDAPRPVFMRLNKEVRITVNNSSSASPPLLARGMELQVLALQRYGWVIFQLDVKSFAPGLRQNAR